MNDIESNRPNSEPSTPPKTPRIVFDTTRDLGVKPDAIGVRRPYQPHPTLKGGIGK